MSLKHDDGAEGRSFHCAGMRAAQYVRMSTEHQKYSTENQAAAIQLYAEKRGISIVRTYADEGRSGLSIDRRRALKQLIDDVRQGRADYASILVYDVSRWGRFQDADESAYYEFICKGAGISVHYCAEPFENDGSLSATIMKNIKRAMAGEYSRELSTKVFVGHCKLAGFGFRQGGIAGYGLRRQLIDEYGQPKGMLEFGQRKNLQTDRVVLVPGLPEEVATVRRIYGLYADKGLPELAIAKLLNAEGRKNHFGRSWRNDLVHEILTNEKYAGHYVYNQVSLKLGQKRCVNAPDIWIRADNAFTPIVEPRLFRAVQAERDRRKIPMSNDEMIRRLRDLHSRVGQVSTRIIDHEDDMPSSNAYKLRFGSLYQAYELAGLAPRRDSQSIDTSRYLRRLRPAVVEDVIQVVLQAGGTIVRDSLPHLLRANNAFSVSVVIARCHLRYCRARIHFDRRRKPNITVAARMDETNRRCLDYFIISHAGFGWPRLIDIQIGKRSKWERYRFQSLEPLLDLLSIRNARPISSAPSGNQ
jgi:DNA invertase Pin-like site-specific DNA recombinase